MLRTDGDPELRVFDPVIRFLHWLTLFLVATIFVLAFSIDFASSKDEAVALIDLHRSFGVTVWVLTLGRLIWRQFSRFPNWPADMPQAMRFVGLLLGTVGVTALLAAALPELTAAGEAVVAAAASPATVEIDNFAFAPATLTVTAGTTVTWKNEDDSPHRIGDQNGTFKSAALETDDTFSHTFAAPGEYPYICTMHPYMVGKIVVRSAAKI